MASPGERELHTQTSVSPTSNITPYLTPPGITRDLTVDTPKWASSKSLSQKVSLHFVQNIIFKGILEAR